MLFIEGYCRLLFMNSKHTARYFTVLYKKDLQYCMRCSKSTTQLHVHARISTAESYCKLKLQDTVKQCLTKSSKIINIYNQIYIQREA